MAESRIWRKRFGGGMRQAGILAAAGLYALDHNVERLADDHARARRAAEAMAEAAPGSVDLATVETNIVIVDVAAVGLDLRSLRRAALAAGVRTYAVGPGPCASSGTSTSTTPAPTSRSTSSPRLLRSGA